MASRFIEAFWDTMGTNDFAAASLLLSKDFEYYMPQSQEYMRGRDAFVAVNSNYPASGPWVFKVHSIIESNDRGVSDVSVTDGAIQARVITFHTVENGLITRQLEFWPDPYPAPEWRTEWTEIRSEPPF
ncbi:MAG: nuclear transport factor 2 family protein [Pseudomonadota bacterium]